MQKTIFLFFGLLFSIAAFSQNTPDSTKKIIPAEISCGQCMFKLKGKGCDIAVRINGKAYFADGIHIDAFGDAHAKDGFCNAIRKGAVQGTITNHRFKVSYIKLYPENQN